MIILRLYGGLGNQMFQYAAGRSLSVAHGSELVLDLGWYKNTPASNTPREYELSRYSIKARLANSHEERICRTYSGRILKRLPLLPRPWSRYQEAGFEFNAEFKQLKDNTYLDGYWQSYKYFEGIADIIRDELMPLPQPSPQDQEIIKQIAVTEAVSVHVRRGDYVSQKAAASVHGVCSLDYYHAALQNIKEKVSSPHFYVFSDDPEWTRKHLSFPGPAVFVDHNRSATAFQDMRLMSQCQHHVVANSSFSWWGAWLNPSKSKLIIAPKNWFLDNRSTSSLTPADWTRL